MKIKPRLIGSNDIILSMVNSILFKIWICECSYLKSWINIWTGMVLVLFINMEDLKKKYLMMIRKNRCLFVNVSLDIDVLLTGKSLYLV